MIFIKNLFGKKVQKKNDYAQMGYLGVSPVHMMKYEVAMKKIKEGEKNERH